MNTVHHLFKLKSSAWKKFSPVWKYSFRSSCDSLQGLGQHILYKYMYKLLIISIYHIPLQHMAPSPCGFMQLLKRSREDRELNKIEVSKELFLPQDWNHHLKKEENHCRRVCFQSPKGSPEEQEACNVQIPVGLKNYPEVQVQ